MPSFRNQRPLEAAVFRALSKWIAEHGDLPFTQDNDLGLSASLLTDALYTNPQEQQLLVTLAAGGSPTEWTKLEPLAHMLIELRDRHRTA